MTWLLPLMIVFFISNKRMSNQCSHKGRSRPSSSLLLSSSSDYTIAFTIVPNTVQKIFSCSATRTLLTGQGDETIIE